LQKAAPSSIRAALFDIPKCDLENASGCKGYVLKRSPRRKLMGRNGSEFLRIFMDESSGDP
jgi:hypothetical protein